MLPNNTVNVHLQTKSTVNKNMLNSYRTLACCAYQLVLTDDSIRISRDAPDPEFSDPAGSGSGQDPQNPPSGSSALLPLCSWSGFTVWPDTNKAFGIPLGIRCNVNQTFNHSVPQLC